MIATPTLWKIYELVKQHCPEIERDLRQSYEAKEAPRAASKPATKKKNKPMNKYEQDQKIKQLEGTLQNFERQTSGSQEPLPSKLIVDVFIFIANIVVIAVEKNDPDSSGDEDSDSEEE
jgi:bromodomain-containing factor 1